MDLRVLKPLRILIADDHELVRQGMRAILQSQRGWTVVGEAATGRQTLDMATELKPDLVVLDLALPEMNGVEVTRRLRRDLDVPVLIVSMHHSDQMVREALEAGANGYVLKADAGRTIAEAIRTILSEGEFISEGIRPAMQEGVTSDPGSIGPPRSDLLTFREREVLQLLAEGRANKEIASALNITTKTVETHRARIMAKLDFHSITELVRYAIRNGIIEP